MSQWLKDERYKRDDWAIWWNNGFGNGSPTCELRDRPERVYRPKSKRTGETLTNDWGYGPHESGCGVKGVDNEKRSAILLHFALQLINEAKVPVHFVIPVMIELGVYDGFRDCEISDVPKRYKKRSSD